MDLIAEFCLIFILLKISANFVYYTSYLVCYKNCRCFFYQEKKDRVKKNYFDTIDRSNRAGAVRYFGDSNIVTGAALYDLHLVNGSEEN